MGNEIKPNSYAWTCPYDQFWIAHFYGMHFENLYGKKTVREGELRARLQNGAPRPEIMLMGNFIVDRAGIVGLCRANGINVVHGEDGFFPHYSTMHADPLGFCWESSLTRMVFRGCSDKHRQRAQEVRAKCLAFQRRELPAAVRKPFVFWPLQLTGDKVNRCDLRVEDWTGLLRHFRRCLPKEYQLVLKEHPRSKENDNRGVNELAREVPNIVLVPRDSDLRTLLAECNAVAGANSTVLYEGRLIFQKPAYVYARSWFTNHSELFFPVSLHHVRELSRLEFLNYHRLMQTDRLKDYTDWFLAQLLARQIDRDVGEKHSALFKEQVHKLSYESFVRYGEDVFE